MNTSMKRRDRVGEDGSGARADSQESETRLRIHLKRSCTDRKLVPQENTGLGLTTDDWQKFKRLLESKTFAAHDTKRIHGDALTAAWAEESGFREPVIAPDKTGMGLKVPESSFTVADIARVVGEEVLIRPIHVGEQTNIDQHMTLAEFAEYFETCTKPGQAILNMISLEFSDTPLAKMVNSPQLVRDIDWVNWCWPDDRKQEGQFPKVQYYCLMSQGGSYTDFHVDFGGTSVWYHILRGKKEFLLVRPTPSNLKLYEGWIRSPTQSQVFFGDLADTCYRVVLNAGETLMIPSGWIHAVFTPKPSLVFGGNFLHSLNIPMQLQIHAIEVRAKILHKFRFPYFREMMFFAASKYLRTLRQQQGDLPAKARRPVEDSIAAANMKDSNDHQHDDSKAQDTVDVDPAAPECSTDSPSPTGVADAAKSRAGEGADDVIKGTTNSENAPVFSKDDVAGSDAPAAAVRADSGSEPKVGAAAEPNGHEGGAEPPRAGERANRLSLWEIEGLPPLLEACRAWVTEESAEASGDNADGEGGVLEEWEAAASAAGCPNVETMLQELSLRVEALEPLSKSQSDLSGGSTSEAATDSSLPVASPAAGAHTHVPLPSPQGDSAGTEHKSEADEPRDAGAEDVSSVETQTGTPTTVSQRPVPTSMANQASVEKDNGVGGQGIAVPDTPVMSTEGDDCSNEKANKQERTATSYSIPKLKISLKPPSSPRPGTANIASPTSSRNGASSSLKLVLKRTALSPGRMSSGAGSARSSSTRRGGTWASVRIGTGSAEVDDELNSGTADVVGENNAGAGVSALLAAGHGVSDGAVAKARKSASRGRARDQDYYSGEEDDFEDVIGDEDERSSSEGDGEARIGRGGKRRARPLGSRLRAIARLGDDATGGDSEDDDSADEYKPDAEDDARPDDHKIKLDAEDVRESKRAKATSGSTGGGKSGSTWGSLGSGSGGVPGLARKPSGGMLGSMRMSVTKQEALRSKGVFKIAPQSKVPVQVGKKEKKPLTAKQKLLLKMRR